MVYTFDDCRPDLDRRELWRGGALIDLEPQAFDLLAYLVHHRERAVSKDDLIAAVWNSRVDYKQERRGEQHHDPQS